MEKNIAIGKECQPELNTIIKLLIEKCYSSSKQALKDKSKDMIISFIEYLNNTDQLVDNLINAEKMEDFNNFLKNGITKGYLSHQIKDESSKIVKIRDAIRDSTKFSQNIIF